MTPPMRPRPPTPAPARPPGKRDPRRSSTSDGSALSESSNFTPPACAAGGRGRLLMLVGEPGIGKTSLADSIAATAASRGFKVLWGRCWESGGAPAYWPWLDLLSELTGMLDEGALRQAMGDGASLFGE